MTISSELIEGEFATLEREILRHTELAAEFAESRAEFFAHHGPRPGALDTLSHRRHLEWFLLERFSPSQGGVPLEVLVNRGPEEMQGAGRGEALAGMLASLASVFEVTGVVPGDGLWARDLAGGGEYVLEEPQVSHSLEAGDLIVGRVYAVGDSVHRMSNAAGFFRDERLRRAVQNDLQRARDGRHGSLRLSQAELEKMFLSTAPAGNGGDAVQGARTWLASEGLDGERVESLLAVLRSEPFDAELKVHGGGDALGRVLDELAFDTEVDLGVARVLLLQAWMQLSHESATGEAAAPAKPRAPADRVDVEAAMAAFDLGRTEGRDLEELFSELERDLQIDGDDEEEDRPAPDFPGVVGALVEEYLWELDREHGAEAAAAQVGLRRFSRFGESIGVFENLGRRELLVFGAVWLPEVGELEDAQDARGTLEALRDFCAWCEEHQGVALGAEFAEGPAALLESLPRMTAVNAHREAGAELTDGTLYEVLDLAGERVGLGDAAGERIEVGVGRELATHLAIGDRLRASPRADGGLALYCGYPPECALIPPADAATG